MNTESGRETGEEDVMIDAV